MVTAAPMKTENPMFMSLPMMIAELGWAPLLSMHAALKTVRSVTVGGERNDSFNVAALGQVSALGGVHSIGKREGAGAHVPPGVVANCWILEGHC